MDSLTHIALGACMGEAFAGKKLGKKSMIWGALAQSIPDIDFISSFWMDTSTHLLGHRGFTHSLLFCAIVTVLFAILAERWHRPHNISLKRWILFFGGVVFIHIFIDAFNNYGVAWFEPFSHYRISFNAIYVVDPLFSIWPALACIGLISIRRHWKYRKRLWVPGLALSALYLMYCLVNKAKIDSDVRQILRKQNIAYTRYFTTPAPLQNWLWFVVAGTDSGYYAGYRSLLDSKKEIHFEYFPRNEYLLNNVADKEELHRLIRFSKQFYTVEQWHDTLVFNDLRFGQVVGWYDPREKFAFHYILSPPANNALVVQRGRFSGWNRETARAFWRRMWGMKNNE